MVSPARRDKPGLTRASQTSAGQTSADQLMPTDFSQPWATVE
jgi:hypothetical protein